MTSTYPPYYLQSVSKKLVKMASNYPKIVQVHEKQKCDTFVRLNSSVLLERSNIDFKNFYEIEMIFRLLTERFKSISKYRNHHSHQNWRDMSMINVDASTQEAFESSIMTTWNDLCTSYCSFRGDTELLLQPSDFQQTDDTEKFSAISENSVNKSIVQLENETIFSESSSSIFNKISLKNESEAYHIRIAQVSKALNICSSSKYFQRGAEYVEAHKILLVATKQYDAVLEELQKYYSDAYVDVLPVIVDYINIGNLAFTVTKGKDFRDKRFLVILSCGTAVSATNSMKPDRNGKIRFKNCFRYENLDSALEITISIYALNIKRKKSPKMRYDIKKLLKKYLYKYFYANRSSNQPQLNDYCSNERCPPSFELWGTTTIYVQDVANRSFSKLLERPSYSQLKETCTMDLSGSITFSKTYLNKLSESA